MCEIKKIKNQHEPSNSNFKQMDIKSANYFNSVERLRVFQNIIEFKLDQKKIINEVQKKEYFVICLLKSHLLVVHIPAKLWQLHDRKRERKDKKFDMSIVNRSCQ
jgi:hypothetical protein